MPEGENLVPWNIRAISESIRDDITKTARVQDLTVGQLVTQVWTQWKAEGSPVQVQHQGEPMSASGAVAFMEACAAAMSAAAAAQVAGLPVDKRAFRRVQSGLEGAVRQVQGLPPLAIRVPPQPPAPAARLTGPAPPAIER